MVTLYKTNKQAIIFEKRGQILNNLNDDIS